MLIWGVYLAKFNSVLWEIPLGYNDPSHCIFLYLIGYIEIGVNLKFKLYG